MDDGDGEREPLANAQGQIQRALIEIVRQAESLDQLGDARRRLLASADEKCARADRGSAGPSARCRARRTATCSRRA